MPTTLPTPRKQRTPAHVRADLSVNLVERFVLLEKHTAQRVEKDYGYDLYLVTYDAEGYVEPAVVSLQVKSAELWPVKGGAVAFDLDIRDYNLWTRELMPVFLVLYDATNGRAYWLHVQGYFDEAKRGPRPGARTVRVRVPTDQRVNRRAVATMRTLKRQAHERLQGALRHG